MLLQKNLEAILNVFILYDIFNPFANFTSYFFIVDLQFDDSPQILLFLFKMLIISHLDYYNDFRTDFLALILVISYPTQYILKKIKNKSNHATHSPQIF